MIKTNLQIFERLKNQFHLTDADICQITGLKTNRSVFLRRIGELPMTSNDIVSLCNYTEEAAKQDQSLKQFIIKPKDFFRKVRKAEMNGKGLGQV